MGFNSGFKGLNSDIWITFPRLQHLSIVL